MANFIITLIVGTCTGLILFKCKVPGGMIVGAIIGVAFFSVFTGRAFMPKLAKVASQAIAGAFIASGISKADLKNLKKLFKPTLILIACMLVLNLTVGFIIYFISPLDLVTSMFAAVPGGMSDIPIISADMGADAPKVAILQFVRLCAGLGILPYVISKVDDPFTKNDVETVKRTPKTYSHKGFAMTISVAIIGATVGKISGIPSGTLLCSLICVITLGQFYDKVCLPVWAKRVAQVLAGSYIGSSVNARDVAELKYLILPAIALLIGYFLASYLIGKLLHKKCGLTIKQGMLAATPAGASDMALIAADVGIDGTDVVVMQIGRMIAVVTVFPYIIKAICNLF